MPVGERVKGQLEEKENRKEQERLQCINTIKVASRELNRETLKEAKPYLEVLRKAGFYKIFREIRGAFKLEWTGPNPDKKEQGGCLFLIEYLIDVAKVAGGGTFFPALITTYIRPEKGNGIKISEQGLIEGGFGLGNNRTLEGLRMKVARLASIKEITISEASLELTWGLKKEIYEGERDGGRSYEIKWWNLLEATVVKDKKSGLFFIDLVAGEMRSPAYKTDHEPVRTRLTPSEWQDRKKVEDAVTRIYTQAFHPDLFY